MNTGHFSQHSVAELCQGLQQGDWSSVELTRYFLQQIKQHNPQIHALHRLNPQALQQANRVDQARALGRPLSPLAGLPMTLKDAYSTRVQPSNYGSRLLQVLNRLMPHQDCQMVQFLQDHDVVILGRSAIPAFSFDWNCRNALYPECGNPDNQEHIPGGSSGGAAAAVAAGLTPIELGSDIAGSIRYPAHCCGVYGLRGSDGHLPVSDIGPGTQQGFSNLLSCGPMGKSLEDLRFVLDLLFQAFPDSRERPLKQNAKIAYSLDWQGLEPEPQSRTLMENTLQKWADRGLELVKAAPPLEHDELTQLWGQIAGYEMAQSLLLPHRGLRASLLQHLMLKRLGPGVMATSMLQGAQLKQRNYLQKLARLRSIQQASTAFFETYAVWALPVSAQAALKRVDCGKPVQTATGTWSYSDYLGHYLCATACLGTPALSFPVGRNTQGLNVSMQVHGPRFSDRALLVWAQAQRL